MRTTKIFHHGKDGKGGKKTKRNNLRLDLVLTFLPASLLFTSLSFFRVFRVFRGEILISSRTFAG
jgi:hypothetical protein